MVQRVASTAPTQRRLNTTRADKSFEQPREVVPRIINSGCADHAHQFHHI